MAELENEFFKSVYYLETLMKEKNESNINLPRICLMGIPYSGKSSILSSIIGLDILPINQNLKIKRPLELKLNHLDSGEPYAIIEESSNEKITDFSKIKDIIQKLQEEHPKTNEGYSEPIILSIYSQKYANVTFIDLPGMTYIPAGACPTNFQQFPTMLASNYANDDSNLLLCTLPMDETNLDRKIYCFRCLESFEKTRHRILPIFTKIDLMINSGYDLNEFKDFLNNKFPPFKFDGVCIKNRTEENLNNNMTLKDAIEEEKKFFEKESPTFGKLLDNKTGYNTLIKKLKKSYFELIKENLDEEDKALNSLIIKGGYIKNKEEKKNKIEILKFINDNSYKEKDAFYIKKDEIKLENEKDKKNFQDLIDFIDENAKDD